MINFNANSGVTLPAISQNMLSKWIIRVCTEYKKHIGTINYIFCNDEQILSINNKFLDHDYYTDIITFDYSGGDKISGDIYISLETIKSNSEAYNTNFEHELNRVIIHGILHLCGQSDENEFLRAEMTEKENKALNLLV